MSKIKRHKWTLEEGNLALDLYFKAANYEEIVLAVSKTGLKLISMVMKLENIRFLDTGYGLKNVSKLTRSLFEERLDKRFR